MKTYEVEFKATTYRHYYVEANNKEEAEEKAIDNLGEDCEVGSAWKECSEVSSVLDYPSFATTETNWSPTKRKRGI